MGNCGVSRRKKNRPSSSGRTNWAGRPGLAGMNTPQMAPVDRRNGPTVIEAYIGTKNGRQGSAVLNDLYVKYGDAEP